MTTSPAKGSRLMIKAGSALGLAAIPVIVAAPAFAADPINDAVASLSSSPVYLESSGLLSNAGEIASAVDGEGIAVVAFEGYSLGSFSPSQVASQIRSQTSYDTVIVVVDGRISVAGGANGVSIAQTLNENIVAEGDTGAGILAGVKEITSGETVSSQGDGSNNDGVGAGEFLGFAGGGLLALAIIGAGVTMFLKRQPKVKVNYDKMPADVKSVLEDFKNLVAKHEEKQSEATLVVDLRSVLTNMQELFKRLDRQGNEQQKRMASVQYVDTFTKLNRALGEDYYLDIQANPRLWKDSDKRLREVQAAVSATDDQIVTNIQQVNASQDLEFQVALESLVGRMDDPTVEDIYKDR